MMSSINLSPVVILMSALLMVMPDITSSRKVPIYLSQKTIEDRDDNGPTQSAFRCGEESFQCTNNICVPISSYCNGIDDCGDESDEPKLCQTARISSTTKSNSKIFTGLITGVINSILAGTTLDDFVTRVMAKILGAPALDDFIDGVISKIMGWMILLIILIIIITSIPFSLLLVCALRPGCTIYKWRHNHLQHVQPPPQLVQNLNELAQCQNNGARFLYSCLRNHIRRKFALVLIIYVVIGLFLVPLICQWLPYSWFYLSNSHQDYKMILAENNKRVEAANALLNSLNHTEVYNNISSPLRTRRPPDFCFVIVTVSRPVAISCLTQVVSVLLPQILNDERTILAVNNAEGNTHKEAISFSRIVPVISKRKDRNFLRSNFDKARQDYLFALQWCSRRRATFTVIFEDDALPSADFLSRLRFILKRRMDTDERNWAILKLFYPEKYQGWGNEFHLIAELLGLSVTGGLVLTMLVYCGKSLVGGSKQISWLLLIICSSLFTMYILVSTGRPHWLAVRKVSVHLSSVVSAPGCCTQANLFPHNHLDSLIEYLEAVQCNQRFPIDLALDKFVDDRGLQKLLVIPNLVKHIGFVSSLPGKGWKNSKEFRVR